MRFTRVVNWRLMKSLQAALGVSLCFWISWSPAFSFADEAKILYTPGKPLSRFSPIQAFGAGIDGQQSGDTARTYTQPNIDAMLSAGFKPLSYRLRTELGIETWHWNRNGKWSNSASAEGYWTSIGEGSSATPSDTTFGFRLPRRGSTIDQANNDGYSRLDDGDLESYWKSNPYLDHHFTGDSNSLNPQWIVINLGRPKEVNAIRFLWADPYATDFKVQYWKGQDFEHLNETPPGDWLDFPNGVVTHGAGGSETIRLSQSPLRARYIRIMLLEGSGTLPAGRDSTDIRDRLGFALREIYLGTIDEDGSSFNDLLLHSSQAKKQTVIYVSSTDPWHRPTDLDLNIEQPSLELIYRSGLTNRQPLLVPVGLLYDTPENAAAEIRYLEKKGYPVSRIELGEEPDGQYVTPEHYAALFVQWADALHKVDPSLKLGGPGFQSSIEQYRAWPDAAGNSSWVNRFLKFLKTHHHAQDFNFFTFEWYPFDDVSQPIATQLATAPALLDHILDTFRKDGLTSDIPLVISEYGYSSYAGEAEVGMPGALLNAEIISQFLARGGERAYFYGYEPNVLMRELSGSNAWGNLALFLSDDQRKIKAPLATFYGAQLMTQEWAQPIDQLHELYPVEFRGGDSTLQKSVISYAVLRPDQRWAVLMINKNPDSAVSVDLGIQNQATGASQLLKCPCDLFQYSSEQYVWNPDGAKGYASPNLPPNRVTLTGSVAGSLSLPPYSMTILRSAESKVGGF